MTDVFFGGLGGSAYTDRTPYSGGIGLPSGRAMSDGNGRAWITALTAGVNGNGATRTISLQLGGIATGGFNVGAGGATPNLCGWIGCSGFVQGGSATFQINTSSSVHFSHAGGGTDTYDGYGTGYNGVIYGGYEWFQGPNEPAISVTPSTDGTQATVVITAGPSDNGGLGIIRYRMQHADDAGFSTGVATLDSTGTTVFTGLTPGHVYHWRATACNGATDAAGVTGGLWSTAITETQPVPGGLGEIYTSTGWVGADAMIYTSTGWVNASSKIYTSAGWVDI